MLVIAIIVSILYYSKVIVVYYKSIKSQHFTISKKSYLR